MKGYFLLFVLCCSSTIGLGQKLQLKKASPFTAVKWKNNQPIVQFNNDWYALEKLDIYTTKELLDVCKQKYGVKWKRRFSEDLVEVLHKMGSPPNKEVKLILSINQKKKNVIGTYTYENREKVWRYNNNNIKTLERITISRAIEDVQEFQQIIEERSSYIHLTDYDYKNAIQDLKTSLIKSKTDVEISYLTYELAKILAEIGDRHSSVKNESFDKGKYPTYSLQLPFSIAPLNGKAIAIKIVEDGDNYKYYHADYPILKSINGIPFQTMVDSLVYKSKKAPKEAKFSRAISEIQQLGRLYYTNNLKLPNQIKIVFTNGRQDTTQFVQLGNKDFRYISKLEYNGFQNSNAIYKGIFKNIYKVLPGNIGYIVLPEMYHFNEIKGFEQFLDSTFTALCATNALIIDLRFNPGGGRDLIQKFSDYITPKTISPWIANVAYLRTDKKDAIHKSMANRFLYDYNSAKFNNSDTESIDAFSKNFIIEKGFETSKFSDPHYMILKSGSKSYEKPVYILVNEHSFSAASVFASAFKGLPNVKIVGVTTDGSSGNSKKVFLMHSNIRIRISTMLSFQRNGKTLDGNGTKPNIFIPENEEQILTGKDSQLESLLEVISN